MSKKSRILILFVLFSIFYFLFSNSVFAAPSWWPLVPCGLNEPTAQEIAAGKVKLDPSYYQLCTRCDLFRLVDNVIHFILEGIVPPVAAVLFIAAGLMIVLAGGNQKFYATGLVIFKSTFWGLVIILASWMITNTFLKSFAPAQADAPWYRLKCEVKEEQITVPPPIAPPSSALCSDPAGLAAYYNSAFPIRNSPELNTLISCVNSRLSRFIDQSKVYTSETRNRSCNYTRGRTVCGACAHEIDSCHYGGESGSAGAKAVDFNAQGISERELYQRLQNISGVCSFGYILFEGSHTHISTRSCIGN